MNIALGQPDDKERLIGPSGSSWWSWLQLGSRNNNALPSALPNRWPHSTAEDLSAFPKRLINVGRAQQYDFHSNFVKTSKYEIYTFLPKFLMEEFNPKTKIANCYFGVIGAMQCIPAISNTQNLPSTYVPLSIVLLINGILQAMEDIGRHRADNDANSSMALVYRRGGFLEDKWAALRVGDFVKLESRETIPCDIVVLSVAEKEGLPPQGICYVETKSLDGETNLKVRTSMPSTLGKISAQGAGLERVYGSLEMEHPNKIIDGFSGVLDLPVLGREAIQPTNVLLRGCVLRNTDWVIGLVVNTGHDTKIMMSSRETRSKTSNLESQASGQIKLIICLLLAVCLTGTTGQAIWNAANNVDGIWYLHWTQAAGAAWITNFFYFFLLHATFIPVSLYVSMSISRSAQSHFINNDLDMYYRKTETPALVRTMTLNEELGQISHVFSDKTGTLTCNIMDFRKASIHGVSYGRGITEIGKASWKLQGKEVPFEMMEGERRAKEQSVDHVTFWCPVYERAMANLQDVERPFIKQFFKCLAICHDTIPERIDGKIKLSASNPDDDALVCAAKYFGFEFCDRREKFIVLQTVDKQAGISGQIEEIELLETIEFSSKRKRMSVIVREENEIRLYTKGADTVMLERFRPNQEKIMQETDAHSRQFADEGLRCLLLGWTALPEIDYEAWHTKYAVAKATMIELDKKKKGLPNLIEELEDEIERGLLLLGATAIEDRLQDGVPECIEQLANAGINFWVLTGDKEETAINIAVACNLVLPVEYMEQVIINKNTAPTRLDMLAVLDRQVKKLNEDQHKHGCLPRALVIDGPSLVTALSEEDGHEQAKLKDRLLEFSRRCKAVVACRVSPDQKRQMVNLIKVGVPSARTLAIGDGANDVAMIQEAHVGVGIKGEEGVQAVNSADYAIAQFKYLGLLILKHGRWNYIRMSHVICYMFYKNILMSLAQFWFNFNCAWSGQKIYVEAAIQMFNLFYTAVPILLLGAYDMDISAKSCFAFPKDYIACIRGDYFNTTIFWGWISVAILESVLCSVLPLYFLTNAETASGTLSSFGESGALTLSVVVIVCNLKILFMQSRIYWFTVVAIVFSILMLYASLFTVDGSVTLDYGFFFVFRTLTGTSSYWLSVLLLCTLILGKDIYLNALDRSFNYKDYQIIQELEVLESRGEGRSGGGGERLPTRLGNKTTIQDADVV